MMLWPSYYPKKTHLIPNKGDRVVRDESTIPYTVVNRVVLEGLVYLDIQPDDGAMERVRLEVVNWYPCIGDTCELRVQPYLKWRSGYEDYVIPDWLWLKCELVRVDGDRAIVLPNGHKEVKVVPFNCLVVVERAKPVNAKLKK